MAKTKDSEHYENIFDRNVNFRERVVYLRDDVDESMLDLVQKAFDEMEKTPDLPIRVDISSYGGNVYDMMGIVDRIRSSPCLVMTKGLGKIMSAATFILAAGDERVMGANSWFMLHELSDFIKGTMSDIKVQARHDEILQKQMYKLYEVLSKNATKAKTFEKLCEKDCYLTPEQTLKLGLIDKISSVEG